MEGVSRSIWLMLVVEAEVEVEEAMVEEEATAEEEDNKVVAVATEDNKAVAAATEDNKVVVVAMAVVAAAMEEEEGIIKVEVVAIKVEEDTKNPLSYSPSTTFFSRLDIFLFLNFFDPPIPMTFAHSPS